MKNALEAGLQVGVYFFSQAVSPAEAVEEAEFVLEHLKHYNITGPVVFDTEEINWDSAEQMEIRGRILRIIAKCFVIRSNMRDTIR